MRIEINQGNTLFPIVVILESRGQPFPLVASDQVTLTLVNCAKGKKIDAAAMTILDPTKYRGWVQYDLLAADVDTAGEFEAWFKLTRVGGATARWGPVPVFINEVPS